MLLPNFIIKPMGGSAHLAKVNYFAGDPANVPSNDITAGEANARLIAAAPELLAALQTISALIGNVDNSLGNGPNSAKMRGDKLNDIRAIVEQAITKAAP